MSPITNYFGKLWNPFSLIRFLSEKKITFLEKDEIPGSNKEISEIFNNFFSSIVAKLNIPKYEDLSVNSANLEDQFENLIIKYKNHPSIRAILDKSRQNG